jgi:hypothetical protein
VNTDDSLFGAEFSQLSGSGWLASDDGSMEIAGFIHFADNDLVTLVHVEGAKLSKAAKLNDPARQVSASKYEIVVGQAVKNLRHLDRTSLAEELTRNQGNKIESAVWQAGARQVDRNGLIARATSP